MKRLLLVLFCVSLYGSLFAVTEVPDSLSVELLTPSLKKRQTRKLVLDNGMQVYLISDPGAEQSSASLTVRVGSWQEPEDYPGLAHFLEHMLFLGTEKYPEEASYQQYIQRNGGSYNALTASDHTTYLFSVNHDAYEEALDRLSWFFRAPLFNPSGVQREMNAVDQEFAQGREEDMRRLIAVHREQANPRHPGSRFRVGNLETLSAISQDALKQWYQENYSANIMHLVLYSDQSLDAMQKEAIEKFEPIKNNNKVVQAITEPFHDPAKQAHMIHVAPVKELRSLELRWELPNKFAKMLDSQPGMLVSHILGHEGETSLLAQLKREGLAEGLRAGSERLGPDQMLFSMDIALTADGLRQLDTVVERCFQAIHQLREDGLPQYVFDEVQSLAKIDYQYQERIPAFRMAYRHAWGLMYEDLDTYPVKSNIPQRFDAEAVAQLVAELTPETVHLMLVADPSKTGVRLDQRDRWYGAEYTIKRVRDKTISKWQRAKSHEAIAVHGPNPFVPEDLRVAYRGEPSETQPVPESIVNDERASIFFAQDQQYLTPELTWKFEIKVPMITPEDAHSFVMGDLYVIAVEDELNSFSYPASIAGLNYAISRTNEGISIEISGYSDKAGVLFEQILETLKRVEPTADNFERFKDSLERSYYNATVDGPLRVAGEELRNVIYRDYVTNAEKLRMIKKIKLQHLLAFRDELFERSYVEGLLYGNMERKEAESVWQQVQTALDSRPFPKGVHYSRETIVLPQYHGPYFLREKTKQQGNAVVLMLQHGPMDYHKKAAQEILTNWIESPFFQALRTKQQTAYVVWNWDSEIEDQLYSFFAVQSNSHDGRDLLARFELVLEGFVQELKAFEALPEQFVTIKSALSTKLQQPPRSQQDMAERLYALAFEHDAAFDRIERRVEALEQLGWEDFLRQVEEFIGRNNKQRLAIMIDGEIPRENNFQYSKMRSGIQLRKISDYQSKEELSAI